MALFSLGEREGIAETADMYIETTLVAMGEEDLQPNEGVTSACGPERADVPREYEQDMVEGWSLYATEGVVCRKR